MNIEIMMGRFLSRRLGLWGLLALVALSLGAAGCEPPNPDANTSTSGKLVVYVDEIYAPMFRVLADSFMTKSPNAKIEVRSATARMVMQNLFDAAARDTAVTDTGTVTAAIVGRMLLPDEQGAIASAGFDSKEYLLAYDGLALVVPVSSPLRYSTLEQLRSALRSSAPTLSVLDSAAPQEPLRFLFPDQNSSVYAVVRLLLLNDSNVAAPARYLGTGDSVLNSVAAGEGVGVMGWLAAHRDSSRLRTLPLGYIDSTGGIHPPVAIHPTSLVTGAYPLKQPIVGYTFASSRSLAVGFLAWLARGQDAQFYMGHQGLQPENARIRIVLPERP